MYFGVNLTSLNIFFHFFSVLFNLFQSHIVIELGGYVKEHHLENCKAVGQ